MRSWWKHGSQWPAAGQEKGRGGPATPHRQNTLPTSMCASTGWRGHGRSAPARHGSAWSGAEQPRLAGRPARAGSDALLSKPAHAPQLIPPGCLWDECRDVVSGSSLLPTLARDRDGAGVRGPGAWLNPGNRHPRLRTHTPGWVGTSRRANASRRSHAQSCPLWWCHGPWRGVRSRQRAGRLCRAGSRGFQNEPFLEAVKQAVKESPPPSRCSDGGGAWLARCIPAGMAGPRPPLPTAPTR